jgi:hypothetical protein
MMDDFRDFRPELRGAIDQLSDAGFYGEAFVLTAALEGAYSTASEMVNGIGDAVLRVERSLGPHMPDHVGSSFDRVLTEIRKVCPALH